MLYSSVTQGFYSVAIHGEAIPADAIEVSDDLYAALLAGQSWGQEIRPPDADHDMPWLRTPGTTAAEITAQRIAEITARLTAIDLASVRALRVTVAGTATEDDAAQLTALETEAAALRAERAGLGGTLPVEGAES